MSLEQFIEFAQRTYDEAIRSCAKYAYEVFQQS